MIGFLLVSYMPANLIFDKKKKSKFVYKKGDVCWSCGKIMLNPKKHYPIIAGMFCEE